MIRPSLALNGSCTPLTGTAACGCPLLLVVPFHLDSDAAPGIGTDIAFDLGVLQHLDLDHAATRIAGRALLGADIDAGRHITSGLERDRRRTRARIGRTEAQLIEAETSAQPAERAAAGIAAGELGESLRRLDQLEGAEA